MLSVCFITRNEEKNIARALASVRGVADEIIVADTGSTDRTIEIAKAAGAVVCHFPWCDDFSAARNFSISHARGDWILWMDADEELLPESVNELRACLERSDALAFFLRFQDLKQADRLDYFSLMWHLRLFRRRDDLRFQGRCHPDFRPGIREIEARTGLQVLLSNITIRHYGYLGTLTEAKLRRAVRLLELELRERPGQLYYLIEYARTLAQLGDPRWEKVLREAATNLLPHIRQDEPPGPIVSLLLEHLMQLPPEQLPPGFNPELLESLAWRWFPSNAPLLWLLARRAAEEGKFDEAERLLRRLVEMGKDHSYDQWVSFDPRLVGDDAKANLGACLVRQGKLDEALALFRELLASPVHADQARGNIEAIEQYMQQAGVRGN
ncbi:MAG TPA: glycosyltransferase [Verrucomicrobiae bacterium]|jgi:tetratricopeptide (TPR) repeat protein|nr:glycosyltransferase [Verrucomicrobiae bacterium]